MSYHSTQYVTRSHLV